MNILKSKGARIETCGTPAIISSQVVDVLLTLTLSDLFLNN